MDSGRGQEAPVAHVCRSGDGTDRPLLWPVTAGRLHEGKVHTHRRKPKGAHTPLSRMRAPHDRLQMPAVLGTPETCGRILTHGRGFRHGYGGVWAILSVFFGWGRGQRARSSCLGHMCFWDLLFSVSSFLGGSAYRPKRRNRRDPMGGISFYSWRGAPLRRGICPLGGLS